MKYSVSSLIAAAALICGTGSASAGELIVNGSFSDGLNGWISSGFGSARHLSWFGTGLSYNVYPVGTQCSIECTPGSELPWGEGFGTITQSFSTISGQKYRVAYDFWGGQGGLGGLEGPQGGATGMTTLNTSGYNRQVAAWFSGGDFGTIGHNEFIFTARSNQATLGFGIEVAYSGGGVDNVSVTPVPEPETYAMLLAGLGLLRFTAKRKKPAA